MYKRTCKSTIWSTAFIGATAGYLILHPYAMLVYMLYEREGAVLQDFVHAMVFSFKFEMLPMGIPFALLGGVAGICLELWLDSKKKRVEAERQIEKLERQLAQLRR